MPELTNFGNNWEPKLAPGNTRYYNPQTGEEISRRQYDKRVNNGTIIKTKEGGTDLYTETKRFTNGASHRITTSKGDTTDSVWRLITGNTGSGRLGSNKAIAVRLQLSYTDTGGNNRQLFVQTLFWSTRAEAHREYQDLLSQIKTGETYNLGTPEINVDSVSVIVRTSY